MVGQRPEMNDSFLLDFKVSPVSFFFQSDLGLVGDPRSFGEERKSYTTALERYASSRYPAMASAPSSRGAAV